MQSLKELGYPKPNSGLAISRGDKKMAQYTASTHQLCSSGKEDEQEKHHDSGPASFCEQVLSASEPFPERSLGHGQTWVDRFLLKLGTQTYGPI